ncbi:MAG TPA: glutamate mutase L [Ktedonobacterales bacterium]
MGGALQAATRAPERQDAGGTPTTYSLLMVDCGSSHTKAALIDTVDGRFRLLARAQAATTLAPPARDLMLGVRDAIAAIERTTGRMLLRDGQLLTPEQDDGSGVDGLALATSIGGPLRILTSGPGREALTGLVHRSIGGLFVELNATPTLSPSTTPAEWQQMLAQVHAVHPHAMLVIGYPSGVSRGQGSIEETAQVVARWLDALREPAPDVEQDQSFGLPVIFTGNPNDIGSLQSTLQGRTPSLLAVDALSPSTLTPLNRSVNGLYETSVLRGLPGYNSIRAMSSTPPAATITALAGMVRYLAQHYQTNVVGVDVGSSSTSLAGATAQAEFLPAVDPNAGVGSGIGHILRARGIEAVSRWLTTPTSEDELREYALMRMLRPHALPATARELEFEYAFAREAIYLALRAPGARLAGLHPLDVLLGTGGVLANVPQPAMGALLMLDALQPRGVTSLVLDTAHIANMLGSVAGLNSTAAAQVAESDAVLLQLGTVISPVGIPADGEPALRVVVEFADGRKHVEDVPSGVLARLPVAPGEQAFMGLYPAPTVDVGLGPGQQARASEPVVGGALGLIVDTRGRPLVLPTDPAERMAQQVQWRQALGLEA